MKGSVSKRKGRRGVYVLRIDLGRDDEGKRKRYVETFHGTREQADDHLRDLLRTYGFGGWTEPSARPLKDYLLEWLETAARPKLSTRTFEDYGETLKRYVYPKLGHLALKRLTPMLLQKFYLELRRNGRVGKKGKGGKLIETPDNSLAAGTVRRVHVILHQALKQAVRWRILAHAPTADVELPRARVVAKKAKALSRAQLEAFVQAAQADRWAALWFCFVFSGCRPEELLGLRRPNVLFEQSAIKIEEVLVRSRQAWKTNPDGSKERLAPSWRLEPPKTARSRRLIPLPLPVMHAIKKHLAAQDGEKAFFGKAYEDHGFVFAGQRGQPLHHQNLLNRHFKDLLKAADLPLVRIYDLRHSHASLLLAEGEHVKVVSERLGHSSTAFTMDTYISLVEDQQRAASNRLGEMFFGESGSQKPAKPGAENAS